MADWYVSSAAWAAIPQFTASASYTVGQIVRPLTAPAFGAQYAFRCTTAGTAGAEPTWPSANNGTVTTGGATFTNVTGQSTYGWSAAAGNIYAISFNGVGGTRPLAGDRVFASSDHSESMASAIYQFTTGGSFGVVQLISVNRAGAVPPGAADILAGAAIAGSSGTFTLDPFTNTYWQGFTFTLSGTGSGFVFGSSGKMGLYFKNCAFVFTTSATLSYMAVNDPCSVTFDNTPVTYNFATTRAFFWNANNYPCDFKWVNTPSAILGTVPTLLFNGNGSASPTVVTCRGVDLSAITGTLYSNAGGLTFAKFLFDSCRIASGVVRLALPTNGPADEVELVNCYDGTNVINERYTSAGVLTTERAITLAGGATDDIGTFSHKMVSSTRPDNFVFPLDSFWLDVENQAVGASRTATVEIVSSASLNNNDIWLALEYQGTPGSPVASFASSQPATPLTAAAAVPTSAAAWNSSPSTPVYQHLQVTFTPQKAGRVRGQVRLGKVSTTVYVNPVITIT